MQLYSKTLLFDLIRKCVKTVILHDNDQFVALEFAERLEYAKNGNVTSHDQHMSPLII